MAKVRREGGESFSMTLPASVARAYKIGEDDRVVLEPAPGGLNLRSDAADSG